MTSTERSHVKFPTVRNCEKTTCHRVKHKPHNGTGKRVATILADQGDHVTVISESPYTTRNPGHEHQRPKLVKGWRPMHRTTLKIPTQEFTDYDTTSKRVRQNRPSGSTESLRQKKDPKQNCEALLLN